MSTWEVLSAMAAVPALVSLLAFVVLGVWLLFAHDDDRGRFR